MSISFPTAMKRVFVLERLLRADYNFKSAPDEARETMDCQAFWPRIIDDYESGEGIRTHAFDAMKLTVP